MNVSLRNFVFVLLLSVPVLLFPTGAAADDCNGACTDTELVRVSCGPVCGNIYSRLTNVSSGAHAGGAEALAMASVTVT